MLSSLLKAPRDLPPRSTASVTALKVASPKSSTPVGSFNEDSLFECPANAEASRFSTAGSVTHYDAPVVEATEEPSAWLTEAFDDDEESGDCSGRGGDGGLAGIIASSSNTETAAAAGSKLHHHHHHQSLDHHWHTDTTSAPTISSTLAGNREMFKTALSAVTMGILEENEAFTSPLVEFPSAAKAQPYCSSLPQNLSRCRSMPRPISGNEYGSLTSATTMGDSQGYNTHRPSAYRTTFNGSPTSTEFRPPHELAAASFSESPRCALQPSMTRHKSIADRLKSVVFEQTGHQPHSCGRGFLG